MELLQLGFVINDTLYRVVMDKPADWTPHPPIFSGISLRGLVQLAECVVDLNVLRVVKVRFRDGSDGYPIPADDHLVNLFESIRIRTLHDLHHELTTPGSE